MLAAEIWRAVSVALSVNRGRRSQPPRKLIAKLRARGAMCTTRGVAERTQLRKAIRLVDRCFPSGPNCFRRVLMEIALDAGAAKEPVHMGLKADGAPNSGHAWLASAPDGATRYDAEFVA